MGNHRDAWVFGAADPNSGTAGLMNLAKVIGQLRQNAGKKSSGCTCRSNDVFSLRLASRQNSSAV